MDHVSSHRGRDIPAEVLHKLNIINDYIAEDKEDFDLNYWPTSLSKNANPSATGSDESNSVSNVSLSRASTRHSIVDSLWGRKASTATVAPRERDRDSGEHARGGGLGLQRTQTWRSDRADSVVGGADIIEEGRWDLYTVLCV